MDVEELPVRAPENGPTAVLKSATVPKLLNTLFPPSSPASEDELEVEVAHAIDEPVDNSADEQEDEESNKDENHVDSLPSISAVPLDSPVIQVKLTPMSNSQTSVLARGAGGSHKGTKRTQEDTSSDSVIPASASDGGSHLQLSLSEDASISPSTNPSNATGANDRRLTNTQASTDNGISSDKSMKVRHVHFVDQEPTQSTLTSSSKSKHDFEAVSSGEGQIPQEIKASADSASPKSSLPVTKRPKLTDKIVHATNSKFSQEYYTPMDTDEMIKASRAKFRAQMAEIEQELDLPSTTLQRSSQAEVAGDESGEAPEHTDSGSRDEEQDSQSGKDSRHIVNTSEVVDCATAQHSSTAFDEFTSTYSDYKGNQDQFVNGLVYLEWLVNNRGKSFLRKSLWDDLIRVLADEYMEYIKLSGSESEKMDCLEFYNDLDQDPVFKKQVITPSNLQVAVSSFEAQRIDLVRQVYHLPRRDINATSPLPVTSLLPEQRSASKLSTPNKPEEQAAEKGLLSDERTPVSGPDESSAPAILSESSEKPSKKPSKKASATSSPSYEDSQPKSSTQRPPTQEKSRKRKPLFFNTDSQLNAQQPEDLPDQDIGSAEIPSAKRQKVPRRTLPWASVTFDSAHSDPEPSHTPQGSSHLANLPSSAPQLGSQRERENISNSNTNQQPQSRPSSAAAPEVLQTEEEDDGDEFPSPRSLIRKSRSQDVQNVPSQSDRGRKRQIGLVDVSEEELAFLAEFARQRMFSQTEEERNRQSYCTVPL